MKSRSFFDLRDISAGFDTNFLPSPHDVGADSGSELSAQETPAAITLSDIPATTSEDGSAHGSEGASATASFALLDFSTDAGHPATDHTETSIPDVSPGAGSIDVIGVPIQEASADHASAGLHIAPLVDSDFAGTTGALFRPTASAPTPFTLTNLAPMPFEGHGAEAAVGFSGADTAMSHPTSGLDATPASGGAINAGLAFLENGGGEQPITNSGVGSGGATGAQVQAALDESGLSVNGSGIKIGVLSDSFNDQGGAAADEADGALPFSFTDSAAPPRASPSSFVKMTPVTPSLSLKPRAVFTESWPIMASITRKMLSGWTALLIDESSSIKGSSIARRPAVS